MFIATPCLTQQPNTWTLITLRLTLMALCPSLIGSLSLEVGILLLVTIFRLSRVIILLFPYAISYVALLAELAPEYTLFALSSFVRGGSSASTTATVGGSRLYGPRCDALAVACDYSIPFCATPTTYEGSFVTSSLSNRVVLCLCVFLLLSVGSDLMHVGTSNTFFSTEFFTSCFVDEGAVLDAEVCSDYDVEGRNAARASRYSSSRRV
jgi:hypothetical protein